MWLLERFIHLFSSSEPMLWDYVPVRYMFDGGAALMLIAIATLGLKEVWTALESGQASQQKLPNQDAVRASRHRFKYYRDFSDGSD